MQTLSRILTPIATMMLLAGSALADDRADFFETKVRPILVKRCHECHTRAKEGGLRVDSRDNLLKGGDSGPAIVPGEASNSLLVRAVTRKHPTLQMPPDEALPPREVESLAAWVANGAVWPDSNHDQRRAVDGHGISQAEREFWSFQPLASPVLPRESGTPAPNPIDVFVSRSLKEKGLKQVAAAGAHTLIRRISLNLTGLPPTVDELDRFAQDSKKDPASAINRLIERQLASQQYGERWGRHWLDLVRYADTAGDASDFPIPEAYKYRNYVIQAFNKDKPYDEFIREQIAGDLLESKDDDHRWEQIIATGYIAISRRIGVSPQNLRHITIEDTINNVGKTFLGLTIGCARCYDHKFDPIPTTDYYSLYGIFDSSVYPHAGAEHRPHRADFVYRIGKITSNELLASHRKTLDEWNKKERAQLEVYRDFQRKKITEQGRSRVKAWRDLLAVREARRPFAEAFPDLEIAYAMQEGDAVDAHVQVGGDPKPRARGGLAPRGFLQILGGARLPDDATDRSGRLELANWIADPRNPLTARVMVNRIWHHHFGSGLVKSTSDFGVRGDQPTHPELLDFLAAYFIEHGWSVKQMHRLILTSRTYQLSCNGNDRNSIIDPNNDHLWRANRRRLDAEQIRDSILMISGQLDLTVGQRHPFDHRLTYFFRQHEPFVGNFPTNRRSVYMLQQRIRKNDFLDLFDGADGNLHFGRRKSTITTLQALFFMNSEFIQHQSKIIAERFSSIPNLADGIDHAFQTIFCRDPRPHEVERAKAFLACKNSDQPSPDVAHESAWPGFIRGMVSSNEFLFID